MKTSILGLGLMGSAIAARLLDSGHELAVWNRTTSAYEDFSERGAATLSRPADAWSRGSVAITMLAHDAAVEAVLSGPGGLLCDGAHGRTAIDMSTISVEASSRLAARAAASGIAFLRAPVTGNPSVVAAGNLGIIISGPRGAYDAVAAMLRDVGPNHFYVGAADQARVVKLGLNLMLAGTAQLMAEAIVMAERNDINLATILTVIGGSVVGSPFVKYKTASLIADDYSTTFSAAGLSKDLSLALDCAEGVGVPLPVTALVRQQLQGCIEAGMGEHDMMALLPRLRREITAA